MDFVSLPKEILLNIKKQHLSLLRETINNVESITIPVDDSYVIQDQEMELFNVKYLITTSVKAEVQLDILVHIRMKDYPDYDLLRFYMYYYDPYRSSRPGCYEEIDNMVLINKFPKEFNVKHIQFLLLTCAVIKEKYRDGWYYSSEKHDWIEDVSRWFFPEYRYNAEFFDIYYNKKRYACLASMHKPSTYTRNITNDNIREIVKSHFYKKVVTCSLRDVCPQLRGQLKKKSTKRRSKR